MNIKQPCFADSSHWNPVDWNNLDPRVLGMIWKITQGKYYIDPTCAGFWRDAKSKGVARSVFHFFESNDVQAQVANFLTACEDHAIIVSGKWMAEIEPVLDAEYSPPTLLGEALKLIGVDTSGLPAHKQADLLEPDKHLVFNSRIRRLWSDEEEVAIAVTGAQLAAQYKAWLDGVESAMGIKPIIYTSKSKWVYTGYPTWASRYKLWTAQYPYNPDGQAVPLYVPYGNFVSWWGWQYSESATVQGFKGDINVYNGTEEEWIEQYGGGAIPPEPPGETMVTIATVISSTLNIRSTSDLNSTTNIIGPQFLKANDILYGVEETGTCLRITKAQRGATVLVLPGPVCWVSIGAAYVRQVWHIATDVALPVNVKVTANGAQVHNKDVPAGGAVAIAIVD